MEDQTVTLLAIFFCTLLQLFLFLYPHLTVLTTDLLFAYKVSHGFESNAGVRAMGAGKLADGMAFAVGKKAEDALTHGGAGVVGHAVGGSMSQTHVADAAIGGAGLTKIAQELTAAAHVIVGGVGKDDLDAMDKLLAALVIDLWTEDQTVGSLAVACVGDGGELALWDVMDDVTVGQTLEDEVDLLAREAGVVGHGVLVDVGIVGEQS